jgi:hypothetical protein
MARGQDGKDHQSGQVKRGMLMLFSGRKKRLVDYASCAG